MVGRIKQSFAKVRARAENRKGGVVFNYTTLGNIAEKHRVSTANLRSEKYITVLIF